VKILYTESSNGWGGQEIRILKEALGLRKRGHECIFGVQRDGKLSLQAKKEGFSVYDLNFEKKYAMSLLWALRKIIRACQIDTVSTHSSLDAWLGGIAARICGVRVVRTRHLSTPIRKGINSRLLYKSLADFVVTTSSSIIPMICSQAKISKNRCLCVPTGVDPFDILPEEAQSFRRSLGAKPTDCLIGTVCVVRSWKGIKDLMQAAHSLRGHSHLKWVIVGGGYLDQYQDFIDLKGILTFTGHLDNPLVAMAALDIFVLLSTANEGISQASLQAAYLQRPLITTPTGGLPEVCLNGKTGLIVPPFSPDKVAESVLKLVNNPELRRQFGISAKELVEQKFTFKQTLDQMEKIYQRGN
jgi:glycosyltransferase involved in cell wall biosynthesis